MPPAHNNSESDDNTPIAITMGEPAGIGSEIVAKAWRHFSQTLTPNTHAFFVIDKPERYSDLSISIEQISTPSQAMQVFRRALPILTIPHDVTAIAGHPSANTATATIASIEMAVRFCQQAQASALVTNPIEKSILNSAGFNFPGHTEFLGALTEKTDMGERERGPVMMLAGPELRTIPLTVHQSLASVATSITTDHIMRVGIIAHQALRDDFGISHPRLAIAGLNPHAGENGLFGEEEQRVIIPAITALGKAGINVIGPLPADTMFHAEKRATFDAAICMYHDQALIPVKTLDFNRTVNVTLGLPIIRTSPDHGTALDIAGKGVANPQSLISAIILASDLAHTKTAAEARS